MSGMPFLILKREEPVFSIPYPQIKQIAALKNQIGGLFPTISLLHPSHFECGIVKGCMVYCLCVANNSSESEKRLE